MNSEQWAVDSELRTRAVSWTAVLFAVISLAASPMATGADILWVQGDDSIELNAVTDFTTDPSPFGTFVTMF